MLTLVYIGLAAVLAITLVQLEPRPPRDGGWWPSDGDRVACKKQPDLDGRVLPSTGRAPRPEHRARA